jgi:hypothetical protein
MTLANSGHDYGGLFYQQFLANNTLGPFHTFADGTFGTTGSAGNPVIAGNFILWGVTDPTSTYATLLYGTPVSNPTFSILGAPGIDPSVPATLQLTQAPFLMFDGTKIWGITPYNNEAVIGPSGFEVVTLRLAFTTNLANPALGWMGQTFYTNSTEAIGGFGSGDYPGVFPNGNSVSAVVQGALTDIAAPPGFQVSPPTFFYIGGFCPGATPIQAGAGGIYIPRSPNEYDQCLDHIRKKVWHAVKQICAKPKPYLGSYPWDPETPDLPKGSQPFREVATIVTPFPLSGDVVQLTFQVPTGFEGVILQGYNLYNGSGFAPGSGDIIWRIRQNQVYAQQWGNMLFSLGAFQNPAPYSQCIWLNTRQLVQMIVNVPNLSGAIQCGLATMTSGLFGFFYPMG